MFSFLRSLFSTRILSLLVPETILIFSCYILAAYWAGGADPSVFLWYDNGLLQIAVDRGFTHQIPASARPKPVGPIKRFLRKIAGARAPF